MRITNDEYTPLSVLAELLPLKKSGDTSRFSEEDLSNHDFLVEKIRDGIDAILNSFERLGSAAYETQGPSDHGVDILLRFNDRGASRRVGLQIKSNREADAESDADKEAKKLVRKLDPESTLLKTLKRQAYEARTAAKVDELWLLPCFNLRKHHKRFTAINAYFGLHEDPAFPVKIVHPREALGLLSMTIAEVDATCIRMLCREDEVLQGARNEFASLSQPAQHLVRETFYDAIKGERKLEYRQLDSAIFEAETDLEPEVLLRELQSYDYVDLETLDFEHLNINPHAFPGLCALFFEGRVRHLLSPFDADEFMWDLLNDLILRKRRSL